MNFVEGQLSDFVDRTRNETTCAAAFSDAGYFTACTLGLETDVEDDSLCGTIGKATNNFFLCMMGIETVDSALSSVYSYLGSKMGVNDAQDQISEMADELQR